MTDTIETKLAAVLDDAFPERVVDEVRPAGPSWNDQNETVCVDFTDGETVYLKVAVDGDGSRITRECAVIDYVDEHCDVAVPSVLASETAGESPYLVTEPMRERNLVETWSNWNCDERAHAVGQVGAAVAEIHTRSFECHGHIGGGNATALVLETGSWTDILIDRVDLIRDLAPTDRFEHHFDEVKAAVEENRDRLDDAPATLVHGDPAQPNVFRSETTVGFVDWEIAHVGDPARELHRVEGQLLPSRTERLVSALHAGYERRAGSLPPGFEDRRPVYDAVWFLSKSGFFEKWVEFEDWSPEEAATWVEAEMTRRLETIR